MKNLGAKLQQLHKNTFTLCLDWIEGALQIYIYILDIRLDIDVPKFKYISIFTDKTFEF